MPNKVQLTSTSDLLFFKMDSYNLIQTIKKEALNFTPGILRPGQSFDSHIGHTVINLSDLTLTKPQVKVLEKGLNVFAQLPGMTQTYHIYGLTLKNSIED